MRGSAAFRTGVAPGGALAGPWLRDPLWTRARAVPSLDLRFADTKSLVDATTGAQLVTFTRASSGRFVGSDGVLRTAVTNLLVRSEEFDNASWTKQSSVSVSANTTAAPNGTTTADTVTADQSLGIFQNVTAVVGLNYVNSVYIKAGTATSLLLRDDTGAGRHIAINPSTGQITGTSGTLVSSGSQAVGDGWHRYWMVYAADTTTVRGIIRPHSAGSAQTFIVWGAQLEQSSTVGEYIPTTSTINSAPRFDHNPTTGESLGLLVEEARTNLLLQSEDFGNAAYTVTAGSITTNTIAAPNGTTTADTVSSTGTTVVSQSYTKAASSITYTASLFVKGTVTALSLTVDDGGTINRGRCIFNLSTGTLTSTTNDGTFTGTIGSITPFPNGWYRLVITTTTNTVTTARHRFFWTGSGTSIDVWGAQLEVGAFPTSYIRTTTAAATRSADVASITGSNFSSWYRQDEGTVFGDYLERAFSQTHQVVSVSNGTTSERISMAINSSNVLDVGVISGGVDTFAGNTPTLATQAYRIGFAYKSNSSGVSANGSAVTDDSVVILPTVSQLDVGARAGGGAQILSSTIRRLTYWPVRLGNNVLQQITQ